jgi:DNA-binding IclR family transcriptional regulator
VRLKIEEKVIVAIYRSMCSGAGGARKEEIIESLGISNDEVEPILKQLLTKGVLSQRQRTERWSLSVA